jgi:hypothetical protein
VPRDDADPEETGAVSAPAADITLRDQFDRPCLVRFADAPLTLLVFSGRATAAEGDAWGRQVVAAAAAAGASAPRVVAVAAVGSVPGFVRPLVCGLLAGQPPVAVDWGDVVAARFGYRAGAARAVLVDAAGRVRAAASGPPSAPALAEFAAVVARGGGGADSGAG